MNNICILAAIVLLVVFASVSLFIPYALLALGALVTLALACGWIKKGSDKECRLGFC